MVSNHYFFFIIISLHTFIEFPVTNNKNPQETNLLHANISNSNILVLYSIYYSYLIQTILNRSLWHPNEYSITNKSGSNDIEGVNPSPSPTHTRVPNQEPRDQMKFSYIPRTPLYLFIFFFFEGLNFFQWIQSLYFYPE